MSEDSFINMNDLYQLWPILIPFMAMGMIGVADSMLDKLVGRVLMGMVFGFCLAASAITAFNYYNDPELFFLPSSLLGGCVVFDQVGLFVTMMMAVYLLGTAALSRESKFLLDRNLPVFLCLMMLSMVGAAVSAQTWNMVCFVFAVQLAFWPIFIVSCLEKCRDGDFNKKTVGLWVGLALIALLLMCYGVFALNSLTGSFDFQKISLRLSLGGIEGREILALSCLFVGAFLQLCVIPFFAFFVGKFYRVKADLACWLAFSFLAVGIIAFARFFHILTWYASDEFNAIMVSVFGAVAIGGSTLANLLALQTTNFKRLMGYSAVAHGGYILLGALVWTKLDGLAAMMAMLIVLGITLLGSFTVGGIVEGQSGRDDFDEFRGLWRRNRFLAVMLSLFLLSLIGVPPLAGFSVKWYLISMLGRNGFSIIGTLVWLNIGISVIYCLRLIRLLYKPELSCNKLALSPLSAFVLGALSLGLIGLFIVRAEFLGRCFVMFLGFFS